MTESLQGKSQAMVVNSYTLIAVIYCSIFTWIYFFVYRHTYLGHAHLFAVATVVINWLILQQTKNYIVANRVILLLGTFVVTSLFATGGLGGAGYVWTFAYIPFPLFLTRGRESYFWIGLLALSCILVSIFGELGYIILPYSSLMLINFAASLLTLIILIYFFQNARNQLEQKMQERDEQLIVANSNLATSKTFIESEKIKDEAILNSIGDGMVITDNQGVVLQINPTALAMVGLTPQEIIGRRWADTVPALTDKGVQLDVNNLPISKAIQSHKRMNEVLYYGKKDNSTFPADIIITPVIENGAIIGSVEIFRDITKEKQIDQAKTEFVSLASHQLRTPLSTINWYAEMLLSNDAGQLNDEQRNYLKEVYTSNQRMIELVNALLNVSRIEMGSFTISPKPTNIIQIAQEVVKELIPLAHKKKIQITESYDQTIAEIPADPNLMRIIIHNFMTNAVKYTPPENGVVKLEVSPLKFQDQDHIQILVSDNGYGIPKTQQDKIFTKLFRADNVRTKEIKGTGLGLYIVKSIIEHTGGTIAFASEENRGTTFRVTFPLSGMKEKAGTKDLELEAQKSSI